MKKTHFLILLISVFFFPVRKAATLFEKLQEKSNISVIDDQQWNGEIGDSIRNKFASPVIGLPQEEPLHKSIS
jgi:hypothetical protein